MRVCRLRGVERSDQIPDALDAVAAHVVVEAGDELRAR